MYALFGNVKPYLKPKPKGQVPRPDNLVFKLHYKVRMIAEPTFGLFTRAILIKSQCITTIWNPGHAFNLALNAALRCGFEDRKVCISENAMKQTITLIPWTLEIVLHCNNTALKSRYWLGYSSQSRTFRQSYKTILSWFPAVRYYDKKKLEGSGSNKNNLQLNLYG